MKRKHFKVPIDRELDVPLSQYNINELLPCLENIEASVLGVTASHAEESVCKDCFYLLDVHSEEEVVGWCSWKGVSRTKCRKSCSFFKSNEDISDYPEDTQLSLWPVSILSI